MSQLFDVVVVGGGPSGTASAIALAHTGQSVAVIERTHYDQLRVGEILPPVARVPLAELGLWEAFIETKTVASNGILACWGSNELCSNDFVFDPYGNGWHIDRRQFDQMLARAAESAGAKIFRSARVIECTRGDDVWQIACTAGDGSHSLSARALIDATGRAATMARKFGARRISCDQLIGVMGFLSPLNVASTDDYALIEATQNGWWYSAQLPDARLLVAYMTDPDLWAINAPKGRSAWLRQLDNAYHTRERVMACAPVTRLFVRAANSSHLDMMAEQGWLAVGDAAMAFDPLSSQGIYKALESGIAGGQVVLEHLKGKRTAGRDYTRSVQAEFTSYLKLREFYYGQEQRWSDSLFWQRRQKKESASHEERGIHHFQSRAAGAV